MLDFLPVRHARLHWPDWTFHMGHLDDGETHAIYPQAKAAYINPVNISPLLAVAHVVGHLELGHHLTPGDMLTDDQCAEACIWARMGLTPAEIAQWPTWAHPVKKVWAA